ncbi:transcriptional regulator [Mesorhizobium sp. M0118]
MSTRNPTLDIKSISPGQCRAARALLDMGQNTLAAAAEVSRGVIIDFEKERRVPGRNNLAAIRTALEAAGVEFINHSGVRLRA